MVKIHKNVVILASLFISVSLVLLSCDISNNGTPATTPGTATTSSSNTVLPSKLMVTIPKSVGNSSGAAGNRLSRSDPSVGAQAYDMLNSNVYMMKSTVGVLGMYSAMLDALISQNSLGVSATTQSGKSITMTQALLDQIAAMNADMGYEAAVSGLPAVGDTETIPDFVYNTTSETGYNSAIIFSDTTTMPSFYWNTARTKVKMSMPMGDSSFDVTYDDTLKASAILMSMGDVGNGTMTMSVTMRQNTASTADGVYMGFSYALVSGPFSYVYSAVGYADNNGGHIEVTMTSGSGLDKTAITDNYNFTATGTADSTNDYATQCEASASEIDGAASVALEDSNASATDYVSLSGVIADKDYFIFDGPLTMPKGGAEVTSDTSYSSSDLTAQYASGVPDNFIGTGYGLDDTTLQVSYDDSTKTGSVGSRYIYTISGNTSGYYFHRAGTY